MINLETINNRIKKIGRIVNDAAPVKTSGALQVGVDLGTADIVVLAVDAHNEPLSAFLEWAEVVRDGIVLDYWGATQIVKDLLARTEKRLGTRIDDVVVSFPPGTDPRTSSNVIEAAGRRVRAMIDEPSSVIELLKIDEGAVVDIGGGTTGVAVARKGRVIYSADEPTGGRHVSLTVAGHHKIAFEEAEKLKMNGSAASLLPVVDPVFRKMADIIHSHVDDKKIGRLYFSGGTCCFPGFGKIMREELPGYEVVMPVNPLYLTPLAIASYRSRKESNG